MILLSGLISHEPCFISQRPWLISHTYTFTPSLIWPSWRKSWLTSACAVCKRNVCFLPRTVTRAMIRSQGSCQDPGVKVQGHVPPAANTPPPSGRPAPAIPTYPALAPAASTWPPPGRALTPPGGHSRPLLSRSWRQWDPDLPWTNATSR